MTITRLFFLAALIGGIVNRSFSQVCYTPASGSNYIAPSSAGTQLTSAITVWSGIYTLGTGPNGSGAANVTLTSPSSLGANTTIYVQAGQTLTINTTWGLNSRTLNINVEQGGTLIFGASPGNNMSSVNGGNFNIWGGLLFQYPNATGGAGTSLQNASQFYIGSTGVLYAGTNQVNMASSSVFFTIDGGSLIAKDLYINTSPTGTFCTKNSGCVQAQSISTNNKDGVFTTPDNTGTIFLSGTSITSSNVLLNTASGQIPTVCTGEATPSTRWCGASPSAACLAKVTGNCNYPSNGANCGRALPILLNFFKASTITGSTVELRWATSIQENSAYFVVERSSAGESWEEIGRTGAKGNSFGYNEYSLFDLSAKSGHNYYRLKEVDLSGNTKIYAVDLVTISLDDVLFLLYPNPSNGSLNIMLGDKYEKYSLEILDVNGVQVSQHSLDPGINKLTVAKAGLYLAKLKAGKEIKVQKLIVQ